MSLKYDFESRKARGKGRLMICPSERKIYIESFMYKGCVYHRPALVRTLVTGKTQMKPSLHEGFQPFFGEA